MSYSHFFFTPGYVSVKSIIIIIIEFTVFNKVIYIHTITYYLPLKKNVWGRSFYYFHPLERRGVQLRSSCVSAERDPRPCLDPCKVTGGYKISAKTHDCLWGSTEKPKPLPVWLKILFCLKLKLRGQLSPEETKFGDQTASGAVC